MKHILLLLTLCGVFQIQCSEKIYQDQDIKLEKPESNSDDFSFFKPNAKELGITEKFLKSIPWPIYSDNKEFVELYYKAWQLAESHILSQQGLPQSPYVDEAFSKSTIWIWDTCFMLHFFKYASLNFQSIKTLNNFYQPIHDGVNIPLRIEIPDNPPLFAWTEYEYFKQTNNVEHIKELLYKTQYLQKHFKWFDTIKPGVSIARSAPTCLKRLENGYLWEGGRSGMDNTPRGRRGPKATKGRPNNPNMLWVDAIAQQCLSALYISKLFNEVGDAENKEKWEAEYSQLKDILNSYYWDKEQGFYFDINKNDLKPMRLRTPASYWALLAEAGDEIKAGQMVNALLDPNCLGGKISWVTVPRNDADFNPKGGYWRGSVWLPTAYMGIKSIEKYGFCELANKQSLEILNHMNETYKHYTPHTIWECYNPTEALPATTGHGTIVRKDFCGWSALGPISLFIENVIGIYSADAQKKVLKWNLHHKFEHGIRNFRFGKILTDLVYKDGKLYVSSNMPYRIDINGIYFDVKQGRNKFVL
jgi:hypothetical protein